MTGGPSIITFTMLTSEAWSPQPAMEATAITILLLFYIITPLTTPLFNKSHYYLGITISNDLAWSTHIPLRLYQPKHSYKEI